MAMGTLEAVVVGAGNRGRFTYGEYARQHPSRLRIVALAEPDDGRRAAMAAEHGIPDARRFPDFEALFAGPRLAPLAIVATGDTQHVDPTLRALERGYHVLLEKPIAVSAADCVRVVDAADRAGRILQIGHVLRFTPFYSRIHQIISAGALGEVVHIDMREHVAHWHMTHSFVRGKFRSRAVAAPIVLAKSCHDLDLLGWFTGRPALRLASFGSLRHFRREAAPASAPARCTDGCPAAERCPYDAVRFYAGPDEAIARSWPWSDVSSRPPLRSTDSRHTSAAPSASRGPPASFAACSKKGRSRCRGRVRLSRSGTRPRAAPSVTTGETTAFSITSRERSWTAPPPAGAPRGAWPSRAISSVSLPRRRVPRGSLST
jgi:predicted dehydrogenase